MEIISRPPRRRRLVSRAALSAVLSHRGAATRENRHARWVKVYAQDWLYQALPSSSAGQTQTHAIAAIVHTQTVHEGVTAMAVPTQKNAAGIWAYSSVRARVCGSALLEGTPEGETQLQCANDDRGASHAGRRGSGAAAVAYLASSERALSNIRLLLVELRTRFTLNRDQYRK